MTPTAKALVLLPLLSLASGCELLVDLANREQDSNREVSIDQVNIRGSNYEVVKVIIVEEDLTGPQTPGVTNYIRVSEHWEIKKFNSYYRCPTPDVAGCTIALDRANSEGDDHGT